MIRGNPTFYATFFVRFIFYSKLEAHGVKSSLWLLLFTYLEPFSTPYSDRERSKLGHLVNRRIQTNKDEEKALKEKVDNDEKEVKS